MDEEGLFELENQLDIPYHLRFYQNKGNIGEKIMKLIACDNCGSMIALGWQPHGCTCGNITGHYRDSVHAEITVKNKETSRVIGIENGVRFGRQPYGRCFVIQWEDAHLTVKEA
jgi:hypothetical protein